MAERPLLNLPSPRRISPSSRSGFPSNVIHPVGADRQGQRLGSKFDRLSQIPIEPQQLAILQNDPAAIVPERALVFEIVNDGVDFYKACRNLKGLEFLGEDEDEIETDEDFFVEGDDKIESNEGLFVEGADKKIMNQRIYFTMPNDKALREILSLWKRYQKNEDLPEGQKEWTKVFNHLRDIRPWGPKDRITEETEKNWQEHLEQNPDQPIRCEVEFWFRDNVKRRDGAHQRLQEIVKDAGGSIHHQTTIREIRYDAALLEIPPNHIRRILDNPDVDLAIFDDVMMIRPQSFVTDPQDTDPEDFRDVEEADMPLPTEPPRAALLDGLPMAQHSRLAERLDIDDPDKYEDHYGQAMEQEHGTSMASLIIHGDLNAKPVGTPIRSRLYVRPVMYPHSAEFDGSKTELMPSNRLAIDIIWQSFIRMFGGSEESAASGVKIVNLSLGDLNRRFFGVMSPWARLIDYLSWEYKVLILVSAGNITDAIPLDGISSWQDFENTGLAVREDILLQAILKQRAIRRLLSPSEGMNAITVGACHSDTIPPHSPGMSRGVDPYENSGLPNPSSALGLGYRKGVKPEILFPGGREYIRTNSSHAPISVLPIKRPGRYFGIGAAAPGLSGDLTKQLNCSGTSVATALATHSALKILESLDDMPPSPLYPKVDEAFHAVIAKTLLVHAAKWDEDLAKKITKLAKRVGLSNSRNLRYDVTRFLGFGVVDLEKVLECTENRATMIGWNTIQAKKADEFRIPLPPGLENVRGFRSVTATAGWFTPINFSHRKYRMATLEITNGSDKGLSLGVSNAKSQPIHHVFGRGAVFHKRWEGTKAQAFVDNGDIVLHVTCKSETGGDLSDEIPYGLAVSLEVGEDVAISVYQDIQARLRDRVPVRP